MNKNCFYLIISACCVVLGVWPLSFCLIISKSDWSNMFWLEIRIKRKSLLECLYTKKGGGGTNQHIISSKIYNLGLFTQEQYIWKNSCYEGFRQKTNNNGVCHGNLIQMKRLRVKWHASFWCSLKSHRTTRTFSPQFKQFILVKMLRMVYNLVCQLEWNQLPVGGTKCILEQNL